MKRLLALPVLLAVPALAFAQNIVSEEWTTYCDGGVEKVRAAITLRLSGNIFFDDNTGGEFWAYNNAECDFVKAGCREDDPHGVVTILGNNLYRWTWEGWPRECFQATAWRIGMLVYGTDGEFGPEYHWETVLCADGPRTIIDNVDCAPTPIKASTWGAVKALYR